MNRFGRRLMTARRGGWLVGSACTLLLMIFSSGWAQTATWQAHTTMRQVAALDASSDALWTATSGGVFRYDPGSGEMTSFTAARGLHGVQTTAIAFDAQRNAVWIGYPDGVLDRLDAEGGTVRSFRDVERATRFTNRRINRLVLQGDSLLVATGFGLVIFDVREGQEEVRDSYTQFATLPSAVPVHDVLVGPVPEGDTGLWLATEQGVAHAPLASPNLKDPTAWTVESDGLPSADTRALALFEDRLYVGGIDVAERRADGTYRPLDFTGDPVVDLQVIGERLIGAARFRVLVMAADGSARSMTGETSPRPWAIAEGPSGAVWLGDAEEGIVELSIPNSGSVYEEVRRVFPDGPYDGNFADLVVSEDGTLWAGGIPGTGRGFYKRDPDGTWTTYSARFVEALAGRASFVHVHAGAQGTGWAASEGAGVAQVTPEGTVEVYDHTNSTLRPASNTQSFVIVHGIQTDREGILWATNLGTPDDLHVRMPDGTWAAVAPQSCTGEPVAATFAELLIDTFDQKWILVRDRGDFSITLGLMVLDTGNAADDPSDDTCRFIGERGAAGQGLPSLGLTALAEDRDGLIWIGTDDGLAYIINNGIAAADPATLPIWPQWNDRDLGAYVLDGLEVNDIAVDPANRLWVATNVGAYLIQQVGNGYDLVHHFTADNTPLFSNSIVSIAVDAQTGVVYFATDRGLISYQGDAVQPAADVQDLLVFPNPARFDGTNDRVCVQGLVEETEVRILTANGTLVRQFSGRGGQVCWDGLDEAQQRVPSGVYLVVAVGQNGEGTAYGKVAVIR